MVYSNHSSDVLFLTANISDAKDCHSMSLRSASTEATTSPQEEAKFGSCRMLVASISMQLGGLGTISGACDFESLVLEPQNRRGRVCRAGHTFQDVSGRGNLGFWRCTVTGKLQMSFEPVRQICQ